MNTITQRFDTAYDTIQQLKTETGLRSINLTEVMGIRPYGVQVSINAAPKMHIDDKKRDGAKGISIIYVETIGRTATGVSGRILDRVSLFRDSEGEVVPDYSGFANVFHEFASGLDYGYADKEFIIPEQSVQYALESGILAVEQALEFNAEFNVNPFK